MSFFDATTRTVEIDADNRAVVRMLRYAERQACLSLATNVTVKKGVETIQVDPARLSSEQLRRAVVSWEGPGFDGRPVTVENVDNLPAYVADLLAGAVDEMNADMRTDEKKVSTSGTND